MRGSYSHNGMNGKVVIFNHALLDHINNYSCRFSAVSVIQLELQQTGRICCEWLRSNNSIEIMVLLDTSNNKLGYRYIMVEI